MNLWDLFPNEEANARVLAITTAVRTTCALNQNKSWFNEVHTQPQSPSSPLRFRVDGDEQEIPFPDQIEGLKGIAVFTEHATEAFCVIVDCFLNKFMGRVVSDVAEEVTAKSEEEESLA